MAKSDWVREGACYTRIWGGRLWSLNLDDPSPGLAPTTESSLDIKLLAVLGASVSGPAALDVAAGALVDHESYRGAVRATYRPALAGEILLTAVWTPLDDVDGVDLQIEASARSVGVVRGLSLILGGRWPAASAVQTLAADSAEGPALLLPPATRPPIMLMTPPSSLGTSYVETAEPFGRADEPNDGLATGSRHRYFACDLERGVLLRARIQGAWVPTEEAPEHARRLHRRFAAAPVHLGV